MPFVLVAGNGRGVAVLRIVDGQVQGDDAVAALGVGQRPFKVAACIVAAVVPGELVAGNGRGVAVLCIVDGQV